MNAVSCQYGWGDKVAIFNTTLFTGYILAMRIKHRAMWYNVSGYGWIPEKDILCTIKNAN